MSDKDVCPFCGEGAYGNGHYKCDTWVVYGDNGLAFAPSGRSIPCYQTELAKLRAVAETVMSVHAGEWNDKLAPIADALEAAGYLQPLTPPSGEEN